MRRYREDTQTVNFHPATGDHGPNVVKKRLSLADRPVSMDFRICPAPRTVSGRVAGAYTRPLFSST